MSQSELFEEPGFELGDVERWCRRRELAPVIGVDEAGRGPLAGPVYAAAVVLDHDDDDWFSMLDDSKKLSEEQRVEAAAEIKQRAVAWSITWRDAAEIDRINILQASLRAMEEAIEDVCAQLDRRPARVFIDGNQPVRTSLPQQTLVKGDARSYHIAAASILAKVERDAFMVARHEIWPEYAFGSNKGYPTKAHREAIATFGPCTLHRKTFGGVREHLDRLRDEP
jgi:ribonuclease HII